MPRLYLYLSALGLASISLVYGIYPSFSVPLLLNIDIQTIDLTHVFRSITGIYISLALFWFIAAKRTAWHYPAIVSVILFMSGLGFARLISIMIDGLPSPALILYTIIEFSMAALGWFTLRKLN